MEHQELTEKIIGCAYRVYNGMGFGFLESVYERCLLTEFRKRRWGQQKIRLAPEPVAKW